MTPSKSNISKIKHVAITAIIMAIKIKKRKQQRQKRKKRLWCRERLLKRKSGMDYSSLNTAELETEDMRGFSDFARMSSKTFQILLEKINPLIEKQTTTMREAISPTLRLLVTLRFLATGAKYSELSHSLRVSVSAISLIVPETLNAIYAVLKEDYLKIPQCKDEWEQIAIDFESKWNIPQCLGAIDGKHIAISTRKELGSRYMNYLGFNSIILLAIVDADYRFVYIDVGTKGRLNDSNAIDESALCDGINNNLFDLPEAHALDLPYVFVADDTFRLSTTVLRHYGQVRNEVEQIFNYRLSRVRGVAENALGILAHNFQILQKEIELTPEKVEIVVLAACALHNFIITEEGLTAELVDQDNISEMTFTDGSWRKDVFVTRLQKREANSVNDRGSKARKYFAQYFNEVDVLPGQSEAIQLFCD